MAVYRKHAAGMWATYATELARHKKLGNAEIAFFRKLRGHFGGRYASGYAASQKAIFRRLAEAYLDEEDVPSLGRLIAANPTSPGMPWAIWASTRRTTSPASRRPCARGSWSSSPSASS